jgi:anti-sigma factor RsiW
MSTTPHIIAPEEIMAHLDGEISADRAHTVSTHIETCPECRDRVQEFQQTKYNVAMWQVASLPAAIENRIQSAATKMPAPRASRPSFFLRTGSWSWEQRVGGFLATAALFLILIGTFSNNLYRSKSISVDSSRANSRILRKEVAAPAIPPTHGDRLTSTANFDLAPPASRSQTLEPTKSDLAMSTAQFQDKVQNSLDGSAVTRLMIARTVSLSLISKDFAAARTSLDAILVRHNGYAANLSVNTPDGVARSIEASLRIPAPQLAAALAELKTLGPVELEKQNGEEVTQQHADLLARLKNSRETEQRLQAILTQRTGKISDVLEVEQEIARVRGEIEQMEAEQKNLEHRVDFATIDLKISEEYKAKLDSTTPSISTQLHNSLVNGYRNVADTLLALLLFFAEYGPILLFWALLLFIPAWLVWRRRRHATATI